MRLSGLKSLSQLGFANGVGSIVSGIFWFYLASLIGSEKYGEIGFFITIGAVASTVSLIGMGSSLVVFTAKDLKFQATIYSLVLILTMIVSIVSFFIFYNSGLAIYIIGIVVFTLVTSEYLGRQIYREYSIYFITQKILLVIFALGLYHIIGFDGILLGIGISYFPFSIFLIKGFKESKIDFTLLKSKKNFILNNYGMKFSRIVGESMDKLIIGPIFGFALLGNYYLGIQFLVMLSIIPGIVYQYVLPKDSSGENTNKIKKYTFYLSILLAGGSFFLIPLIMPKIFPGFDSVTIITQIICLTIIPKTVTYILMPEYLAKEKSKFLVIASTIFVIIQTSLIIILGNLSVEYGIASALVIATSIEAGFLVYAKRYIKKSNVGVTNE